MLYEYLRGKSLPSDTILQRACAEFQLEINYNSFIINARSFAKPDAKAPSPATKQLTLDLQEAIDQLRNEDLSINIMKKENGRIELQVNLRLGSAG